MPLNEKKRRKTAKNLVVCVAVLLETRVCASQLKTYLQGMQGRDVLNVDSNVKVCTPCLALSNPPGRVRPSEIQHTGIK